MKRYMVAASALLLGTSALALAAKSDKMDKPIDAPVASSAIAKPMAAKPAKAVPTKAEPTLGDKAQMQLAMLDETGGKDIDKPLPDGSDGKIETAAVDKVDKSEATGMGGPLEQADADLTPRLATQNYPPCNPGPGDDHCIQLYEPGVRAQLASWNQPTGGLADGSATNAMGGPYEPVEMASADTGTSTTSAVGGPYEPLEADAHAGMHEAALADPAPGETEDVALASHDDLQGVGGPVEAQSGYPPCAPGPGDDRCIQLYEPGVTGAGN